MLRSRSQGAQHVPLSDVPEDEQRRNLADVPLVLWGEGRGENENRSGCQLLACNEAVAACTTLPGLVYWMKQLYFAIYGNAAVVPGRMPCHSEVMALVTSVLCRV